ncbi:MAG: endopeptidase La [Nitrospiria bacterium]
MTLSTSTENDVSEIEIPDILPLLPIRDIVVFPYMVLPLFVGRDMSIKAIESALGTNKMVLLVAQKSLEIENPGPRDMYSVGTIGMVMRMLKLPDGRIKILVQGISKAKVVEYTETSPFFTVKIEKVPEIKQELLPLEVEALMRTVKEQLEKIINFGRVVIPDIMVILENIEDPGRLADMIASNLGLKVDTAQEILEMIDPVSRLKKVNEVLSKEIDVLSMQQKIQAEAKGEMDKTQREYYLREQVKAIQKELGDLDERSEEVNELRKRFQEAKMPEKVGKEADKQLKRLERMHPDSAEAATLRTYLETLAELPWSKKSKDKLNIRLASKILNEDHFDLEKVKERILEFLAVRKMKEKMKGPILCFAGPPGVGKTSLGKSIARSLGREFVRISLGGIRDEAEIRGHRRTYVGALPGKIIQGIKQAGTLNPVFMMDEVDKIGTDFRGDPSSALLEVLDPEQNNAFMDHYLAVPFDLSNVMFITTANLIHTIPGPLRDRMEVIEISGYTLEEKMGIATQYLIPRQLEANGITKKHAHISEQALRKIISEHTREAGVRNLEREIATVFRKVTRKIAEGKPKLYQITPANLNQYLGIPKFLPEEEMKKDEVGVTTGLAWTEVGGDIIYVEATLMKGKGSLILTGQLGDVMKESAQAALSFIRSKSKELGIPPDIYSKNDIHIHVPAGAIPKDGPSAGITMACSIASAFTGIPVRKEVAMTGEITLRGRVLPIGGLKEKILAAKAAGIKTILLPKRNEKDLEEIPKHIQKDLKLIFVETTEEVLQLALKRQISPPHQVSRKRFPVSANA